MWRVKWTSDFGRKGRRSAKNLLESWRSETASLLQLLLLLQFPATSGFPGGGSPPKRVVDDAGYLSKTRVWPEAAKKLAGSWARNLQNKKIALFLLIAGGSGGSGCRERITDKGWALVMVDGDKDVEGSYSSSFLFSQPCSLLHDCGSSTAVPPLPIPVFSRRVGRYL